MIKQAIFIAFGQRMNGETGWYQERHGQDVENILICKPQTNVSLRLKTVKCQGWFHKKGDRSPICHHIILAVSKISLPSF